MLEFCLRIGGKPAKTALPHEFDCEVDPREVLRHWDEFKRLLAEARWPTYSRIYFGTDYAYFFALPREGEYGFAVVEYGRPMSEEEMERLQEKVEDVFISTLGEAGFEPEFHYLPEVEAWEFYDGSTRVDVEARVHKPDLDLLDDIAEKMLRIREKIWRLLRRPS